MGQSYPSPSPSPAPVSFLLPSRHNPDSPRLTPVMSTDEISSSQGWIHFNLETAVGSQKSAKALRVRHEITGTIGRGDFGVSQGAKSAHTGSMEAMSDAGGAQKRPALWGGPSLARGGVAPRSHSPASLPRRALPRSQIWASQLSRLFRDEPLGPARK